MKYLIQLVIGVLWLVMGCGTAFDSVDGDGSIVAEGPVFICGNGVLEPSEECDDGAFNRNDTIEGCRRDCTRLVCGAAFFAGFNEEGEVSCIPHVVFEGNARIDGEEAIRRLDGYTLIEGNLVIIDSLPYEVSLVGLREVRGSLWVWDTRDLEALKLQELARVGGDILFRNNSDLQELFLQNLQEVGGNLAIAFNARLPTCVAWDISRQVGEGNVQGVIKIEANKSDSCD